LAGHNDSIIIFESAAYYALTNEELEKILPCKSEPVLKAYLAGLFRAACRLWKFIMPVEDKAVFQSDVFHPATVNPKLQAHLGLTPERRIFDKYVGIIFQYVSYLTYLTCLTYFAYSVGLGRATSTSVLSRFPRQDKDSSEKGAEGAMTGDDYDLMLHCTIGHLRRVN
jgi:hypothetical protein